MKDRLFTFPGVGSVQKSMVSMLLTQAVFIGIFFGAFDISAHSLFLSIFDEKMMARGYVLSGLAGIILTLLYTRMQTRMLFRNFAVMNLIFVTTLTFLLWFLLIVVPNKWVIFLVFVMLGPLNILALLGFRGTSRRLFTTQPAKRLSGLVDAGLIFGIIISCYAIPALLSLNFNLHNILLVSAVAVLTGSIIQIMIRKRFLILTGKSDLEPEKTVKKSRVLSLFLKDQYIRIMGLFMVFSVMTAFFVQYSFMAVTREQYPAEEDMARFLGLFIGSMMIIALLIRLLVYPSLIRNYGIRTCMVLSPVLIAAFTVIIVLSGLFRGYTPAASGFMIFFMLLAVSRLFSKSLKDSVESPSFKVMYQTIDEKIRYEVQSAMDGTVNEIAAFSSGLILAGLGLLSFVRLIHFSIVLILITIIWVLVAVRLYAGYRNSVRKALETAGQGQPEISSGQEDNSYNNRFSAELAFKNEYFNLITGSKTSLEKNRNSLFYNKIIDHSQINKDVSLLPVIKSIALDKDADQSIRQRSAGLTESLELLLASGQQNDDKILNARIILAGSRQPQTTQILRLLRDNSIESKKLAIYMIGKFRLTDMITEVCECLNIPGLEVQAANVLKSFGSSADEELRRYYMISSGNTGLSKTVLRLLGDSCRIENQGFLFSCLWSNSRQIKEVALGCLKSCDFKPPDEDKSRLQQLISDVIGIMVWNLSARITLRKKGDTLLLEALNKEIVRWNKFLFNILSITYDKGSISRIMDNLDIGTVESVSYTLEIIDIVIDESLKPKLIPLIDIISDKEKVRKLYRFYPGEIHDYNKLIEDIINRDYNSLGIWIRACAIRNMADIENDDLSESIVALLFSPENILRDESARLIARSGREIFKPALARIPDQVKNRLGKILKGQTADEEMLYEKVRFLATCFSGTDEEYLLFLAEKLIFVKDLQLGSLPVQNGYILWQVGLGNTISNVEIIYEPQKSEGKFRNESLSYFYILPLDKAEDFIYQFPEFSSEILKYISNYGINQRDPEF
jgi:ATP/ADP translocase